MKPFARLAAMLLVTHAALLSACGPHEFSVRSGLYRLEKSGSQPDLAPSPSFALEVDRTTETLRILFGSDVREVRMMVPLPREYWRSGCLEGDRMELLDLGEADLSLMPDTLKRPMLSAVCLISGSPEEVTLLSGGSGARLSSCSETPCPVFRKVDG